jgi:uncharacterized protein (TIGR03435 family)
VKRSVPGSSGFATADYLGRGGVFRASKIVLQAMVLTAYGIREDQLVGGPNWTRSEMFDIEARAGADATRDRILLMVQSLLEDRFGLRIRRERRERDIYALRVARPDGRLGSDLRRAPDDCRLNLGVAEYIARLPMPSNGARPSTGGACETMASIARMLERKLLTTVSDETGLTGIWDYVISYGELRTSSAPLGAANDRPVLEVALEEQLGLRLERKRGTVEVVVVESVHAPTEN